MPQDTAKKHLWKHTQDTQTLLVTPTKGMSVTAKEAVTLPIIFNNHYFIDTLQNPISKGVSFNILIIQFSDLNAVSNRQDPNTGFTKYRPVIKTGSNTCIDCITCIGFTNTGFNPTSNFFQHTGKYLNTQTPRVVFLTSTSPL
ncbi:hypothetical protein O181_003515 [Austropuccinia psidii MF-1]|uniref:Uncharacterized protein n=1 Tax=Austropuccinia psidii MF-1 TaxID=1389203 RepID=A0A9Q3BF59_9BASI|nr:hypothetical protein [Austropuccinia psidii MF-1]